jgi:negative regulator of flagellin synthesis FlgM
VSRDTGWIEEKTMKINGSTDLPRLERAGSGKADSVRPQGAAKAGADSVSLSDLAGRLQSLEAEMASGAPLDAGKVEEIKQAIREGRFKVNPEVVADRLIQSMKELLAKKA